MEGWRKELDQALGEGLKDSDDGIEEQLFEDLFFNLNIDPYNDDERE